MITTENAGPLALLAGRRRRSMSEERPQHSREPAEGAEEAEEVPGFERANDDEGTTAHDEERSVEHPQEPAEGAEEDEEAPGAERARGDS
jgi:hypothetical protein